MRIPLITLLMTVFFLSGCSQYTAVEYREVDRTNYVVLKQETGAPVEGTVVRPEPHQLVLLDSRGQTVTVSKSVILSIKRKQPVLDDFGRGIAEEEIRGHQMRRSTTIYGIGGGILSFGISFFAGSMLGNASDRGATVMAATAAGGTLLGTALFLHAGRNQDRKTAVQRINTERKSAEIVPPDQTQKEVLTKRLEDERKKQEELRKEREALLKQLQQPSGNQ
jgi:hypothetical protein